MRPNTGDFITVFSKVNLLAMSAMVLVSQISELRCGISVSCLSRNQS